MHLPHGTESGLSRPSGPRTTLPPGTALWLVTMSRRRWQHDTGWQHRLRVAESAEDGRAVTLVPGPREHQLRWTCLYEPVEASTDVAPQSVRRRNDVAETTDFWPRFDRAHRHAQ